MSSIVARITKNEPSIGVASREQSVSMADHESSIIMADHESSIIMADHESSIITSTHEPPIGEANQFTDTMKRASSICKEAVITICQDSDSPRESTV